MFVPVHVIIYEISYISPFGEDMQQQLITDIVSNQYKNAPPSVRFRAAWTSVVKELYAQFPSLELGKPFRHADYDPSVTIPAFNAWIDRMWAKRHAQIQALRALEKMNKLNGSIQPLDGSSQSLLGK
jgi:hypothetical protein